MSIQRGRLSTDTSGRTLPYIVDDPDGDLVAYHDHIAVVAEAEQRVTQRHNAEHEDDRLVAFQNGYTAGLDAARDAVVTAQSASYPMQDYSDNAAVLAAIDALRGES